MPARTAPQTISTKERPIIFGRSSADTPIPALDVFGRRLPAQLFGSWGPSWIAPLNDGKGGSKGRIARRS